MIAAARPAMARYSWTRYVVAAGSTYTTSVTTAGFNALRVLATVAVVVPAKGAATLMAPRNRAGNSPTADTRRLLRTRADRRPRMSSS
jgi:hypothetical protein